MKKNTNKLELGFGLRELTVSESQFVWTTRQLVNPSCELSEA